MDSKGYPNGFTRENTDFLKVAPTYQKRALTHAVRVHGPFRVTTREGEMECPDGYLALDSKGYPYPIAKDVFEETYVLIDGRRFT